MDDVGDDNEPEGMDVDVDETSATTWKRRLKCHVKIRKIVICECSKSSCRVQERIE